MYFIIQIYFMVVSPASKLESVPTDFTFLVPPPAQARIGTAMTGPNIQVRDQYGKVVHGVCIKASVPQFDSSKEGDFCNSSLRSKRSLEIVRTEKLCVSRLAGETMKTDSDGSRFSESLQ